MLVNLEVHQDTIILFIQAKRDGLARKIEERKLAIAVTKVCVEL